MPPETALPQLPAGAFARLDGAADADFYARPRLVTHIDDPAIGALTGFYRQHLPEGARLLDLMSSWVSHLPPDVAYGEIIGHGMNAVELAANPRLTRWFVQDLNQDPRLALPDASLDAVLMCVAIQYLQQPVAVLAEVRRLLVPGGLVLISFSNRCFPTKAVAIWQVTEAAARAELVALYLRSAGFKDVWAQQLRDDPSADPLSVVAGRAG